MFVYKFNDYTKTYYRYDHDEHDMDTVEFDVTLHDNNLEVVPTCKTRCVYCGTEFTSRNKLFYHLGFMNIDIRTPTEKGVIDEDYEYHVSRRSRPSEPYYRVALRKKKRNWQRYNATRRYNRKLKKQLYEELCLDIQSLQVQDPQTSSHTYMQTQE